MATRKALTPLTSPKPFTGFVAVRHSTDGYDWLDAATVSGLREETERLATQTDREIPTWAAATPLVAIRRFSMVLEETL
jgi:hypothetical protein